MKARFYRAAFILLLPASTVLTACGGFKTSEGVKPPAVATMSKHAEVRQSLDRLIAAYETKNSRQFDDLVSDGYTGEARSLAASIRREFSAYHDLSLRYTVNNLTLADVGNKASVAITFTRGWTDIKTGKAMNETMESTLIFVLENGVYRLYSQSGARLFGSK